MHTWAYATVEWVWDQGGMRVNVPGQPEAHRSGSYQQVVELLTEMGAQGWEVTTCVAAGNWLYWTLRRPAPAAPYA